MCLKMQFYCICDADRGLRHASNTLLDTGGKDRSGTAATKVRLACWSGRGVGRGNVSPLQLKYAECSCQSW